MNLADTMQQRTQDETKARKYLNDIFTPEGSTLITLAIVIAIIGFLTNTDINNLGGMFHEFYANISSELISIAITVAFIDSINKRRQDNQELTRLKALLASNESVVTKIAIAELNACGWLRDGSLQGVQLRRGKLQDTQLRGANLQGANLLEVNLQGADLQGANLKGAILQGANLRDAILKRAKLQGTQFFQANLQGAGLSEANLQDATLVRVNLQRAILKRANLQDADLRGTSLEESTLRSANLQGADLRGSNLQGAKLAKANMENAKLENAILPDGTKYSSETDMERFTNPDHPNFLFLFKQS